jgi:uncharacterized protein (DUF1778 family)
MRRAKPFSLRVAPEVREWIETQAGRHGMTMTDYVLQMLAKGIQAATIDETVARISAAAEPAAMREVLRQTLAMRYIVEAQAKGNIKVPETLGTDALIWADRELNKLLPEGATNGHRQK